MKKILLAAMAATLLLSAPAQAQSFRFSFGVQSGNYSEQQYERRREREYRQFWSQQPSYWPRRCDGANVVVYDPYTQRRVCVNRYHYREYQRSQREDRWDRRHDDRRHR